MIAAGQEFAEDYWLPEDDHGTGRRVRPRPLRWNGLQDSYGAALRGLYRQLITLRHDHPAFRSPNFHPPAWSGNQRDQDGFGVDAAQGVVVFHRWGNTSAGTLERFIVALNFSDEARAVTLSFPANGRWSDMLAGGSIEVDGYRHDVILESHWGHIYGQY